jgi:hypothetical protein
MLLRRVLVLTLGALFLGPGPLAADGFKPSRRKGVLVFGGRAEIERYPKHHHLAGRYLVRGKHLTALVTPYSDRKDLRRAAQQAAQLEAVGGPPVLGYAPSWIASYGLVTARPWPLLGPRSWGRLRLQPGNRESIERQVKRISERVPEADVELALQGVQMPDGSTWYEVHILPPSPLR